MLLMLDNYDSFVFNLVRYIEELGEEVIIYRNNKITIEEIEKLKVNGIIISPGPKSPKEAGRSLEIIDYFKGKIPILGICLGHQCIGDYFGGDIIKGKEPVHGKMSMVTHSNSGIFKGIKNPLRVTRYHSLILDKNTLPNELEVSCETDDGIIMGVNHKNYPIFGVQFHPEAEMTEEGHNLLNNFLNITREFKGESF
ncbi:anthranilate synthase component II [Clostridium septicum]|uniref:Aminodeoxychorismate/anthranilate synthase component II n=1 Tax=Clostridium septicum TaxID=1504 RepID=A0A9N7JNT2_CLOSE|nr:aminodeoxychorismate/anthranilate synthase component II [Clostridium septicum]AYE35364.1 type 1 glutamine amidotransferase [Clostridium septicum]MDU1315084.1 aminodeoxychorismate/anthranilate synthase component II [Clostridium septicum]QAS60755.1 aminodeoxychorismate/anthranilate synthase component II [Clostridium septicum]UEC19981.1 aminodeoxychorismate/anthranilate synthase component II [Clostridium septicum]USS01961.1 aminodeoxychorismate/anthranilate synthase component II [Clostridium s